MDYSLITLAKRARRNTIRQLVNKSTKESIKLEYFQFGHSYQIDNCIGKETRSKGLLYKYNIDYERKGNTMTQPMTISIVPDKTEPNQEIIDKLNSSISLLG